MIKYITVLSFVLFVLTAGSQNVIVTGKAPNQANKLVRIITYDDLFSNLETTLVKTTTDESGDFAFGLDISDTKFAFLSLGLDKGEFYLSPNSSYLFDIPFDTSNSQGSIFDRLPLRFSILADDGNIQTSIEEFNIDYNDFVYNNVNRIYRSRDKSAVVNFISRMNEKYKEIDQEYFINYLDYSLASLLWLSKKNSNQVTLIDYFINKPVLYNNIQYTEFFKEFFRSYFNSEKTFRYEDVIPAINNSNSIEDLNHLISRDTLLAMDTRISEIVSMMILSRYYYDRYVNKEKVISKLDEIAKNSIFDENKKIALNYIVKLQVLQNGTPAPEFQLVNAIGEMDELSNYHGKFVLLAFTKTDCRMCEFHMKLLDEMSQKLGFNILTIVAGDQNNETVTYATERGFTWPILKTGDNILLLEDYNIVAYPSYILINPDGTIAYVHLPMPEENMEIYIQRFIEKYNSEKVK